MRVGGSVWEVKIDPKRLREEIQKQHRNKKKEKIRFIDPVDVLRFPERGTGNPGRGLFRVVPG